MSNLIKLLLVVFIVFSCENKSDDNAVCGVQTTGEKGYEYNCIVFPYGNVKGCYESEQSDSAGVDCTYLGRCDFPCDDSPSTDSCDCAVGCSFRGSDCDGGSGTDPGTGEGPSTKPEITYWGLGNDIWPDVTDNFEGIDEEEPSDFWDWNLDIYYEYTFGAESWILGYDFEWDDGERYDDFSFYGPDLPDDELSFINIDNIQADLELKSLSVEQKAVAFLVAGYTGSIIDFDYDTYQIRLTYVEDDSISYELNDILFPTDLYYKNAQTRMIFFGIGALAARFLISKAAIRILPMLPFAPRLARRCWSVLKNYKAFARESSINAFEKASEYGFNTYQNLRSYILQDYGTGSGLNVHHLIEGRFRYVFKDIKAYEDFTCIVLTKAEHQIFTRAWRTRFPYGTDYNLLKPADVLNTAYEIYGNYPDIIQKLMYGP